MESDSWVVLPGSQVRLTSARIGLMSMDAVAPISSGLITRTGNTVTLDLEIALDQLKANLLLQSAARALVKKHSATRLTFHAEGPAGSTPWEVAGAAKAGDIEIPLALTMSLRGDEVHAVGSANLGTVELPLPGVGRRDNFSFSVEASLTLRPGSGDT